MPKYKFETVSGSTVNACETDTESKAWEWIARTKQLSIEQAKTLYKITKIK